MDEMAEGVLAFIRWTDEHPLPPNAPTRDVLNALRAHLDATVPGWRGRAFEEPTEQGLLEVEVHLSSGRAVRGALAQQPSAARGEGRRRTPDFPFAPRLWFGKRVMRCTGRSDSSCPLSASALLSYSS